MKHIFLIHSHITREVAWAVIRRNRIALHDAVFVLDRKFETKEKGIRVVPLDLPDEFFLIYKNPLRGWRHLLLIGEFIDNLSIDLFHCYLPHTYSEFASLMTIHPRCRGYSLMEEGLWSYFPIEKMNEVVAPEILGWTQRLLSSVLYMGRFRDRHFCRNDYASVYCTSDLAFPGFARKVVVEVEISPLEDHMLNPTNAGNKVIVLDSVVETKVVAEQDFLAGFNKMLDRLGERLVEGEVVYLKRHPYQYVRHEFSDLLLAFLRQRLPAHEVRELAGDVSMEKLALNGGVEFYLNVSSVSVYAAKMGCKVYSCARAVGERNPNFMRHLESLPRVFHDSVEFI